MIFVCIMETLFSVRYSLRLKTQLMI